jgi:hypothetical protein
MYRHLNIRFMLQQLLQTSINQLKCALTHHTVSEEDENKLFERKLNSLKTKCKRCKYPLLLRIDPADPERNYYMLLEG